MRRALHLPMKRIDDHDRLNGKSELEQRLAAIIGT